MNEDVLRISSCSDRRTPSSGMRHLWPAQHLEKHSPLCGSGYPWNSVCMCVCACVCTRSCRCCRTAPRVPRPQIKTHICKTKKKKKKSSCKCHIPVAFLPVYAYAYRPWTTRVIYCECAFHFMCLSQGNYSMSCCRRVINEFLVKRLWA